MFSGVFCVCARVFLYILGHLCVHVFLCVLVQLYAPVFLCLLVYLCACVFLCILGHLCARVFLCILVYLCACVFLCIQMHLCACVFLCVLGQLYVYVFLCVHVFLCILVHLCACVFLCMQAHLCACVSWSQRTRWLSLSHQPSFFPLKVESLFGLELASKALFAWHSQDSTRLFLFGAVITSTCHLFRFQLLPFPPCPFLSRHALPYLNPLPFLWNHCGHVFVFCQNKTKMARLFLKVWTFLQYSLNYNFWVISYRN